MIETVQMPPRSSRPALGAIAFAALATTFSVYFAFAAVQGDYGLFRRAEIEAETARLSAELARLEAEVARMENLTLRLSDHALDLDLLDQQARDVLGLVRVDEVVVQ
jgi:cell division protein FtsB